MRENIERLFYDILVNIGLQRGDKGDPTPTKNTLWVQNLGCMNNEYTRHFLEYEDKQIRAWNKAAKEFGTGPYRKNKYTGEVK